MAVAQKVDQFQVNQFAWVFLFAHQVSVAFLVRFLETVVGLAILDDVRVDAALAGILLGGDVLLALENLVTDSLEAVLEEVADFI